MQKTLTRKLLEMEPRRPRRGISENRSEVAAAPGSKGLVLFALLALALRISVVAAEPPTDWIDPDTGHRIVRLSREPGTVSLYFHQDAFTRDGKGMIVIAPTGLEVIDLATRENRLIVPGMKYRPQSSSGIEVGEKTGRVYYARAGAVFSVDPAGGESQHLVDLPKGSSMSDINADETLLVGAMIDEGTPNPGPSGWPAPGTVMKGPDGRELTFAEQREVLINQRLEKHLPMTMFTIDLHTGVRKDILHTTDWLGHIQFSPVDPTLLMFCHEGNWHKVDRIWTMRTDGSAITKIHTRTMNMEIAGHEFFGQDGRHIWYDLQTPRGEDFWLAGYELSTGRRDWYHLQRNEWSVHFNVSPDGTMFAGDGGDSEMVAHAPDGKWIMLFRPQGIPDVAGIAAPDSASLIHPGVLKSERLVNLAKHDYSLEPNVHFTPDMKWIVFRSNMHGAVHVYAVEIARHPNP
ncbi:MAG TPA: oligogalacturonate lyase family protein [Lacunisphaera sp.]